ncbi:lanthionine synthetase C family protein [Nonomuraea fastidiosa]|uniref:lanthionine synthetase C family protein n=1 Tax=Nonomuraea TaxID=83681 RepID=UPI00366C3CDD
MTGPGAQSLANGTAGMALLHIERAHVGTESWHSAHAWIKQATSGEITSADHAGLYYGAPAVSFLLHAAQADGSERYHRPIKTIDSYVTRLAERRLAQATARADRGDPATFHEYDLFYGLTGIAALLLRHSPDADILPPILRHLIRLTHPTSDGLPGWWVAHDPDRIKPTPGGHANLGMAHGAAGLLALLSITTRQGVAVDGQSEAIDRLCAWFDRWRQDGRTGPWWPQWITLPELADGRLRQPGPPRPSWCYGTPGIARALQLAGLALDDVARQQQAEHALAACLNDPAQLRHLTGPGLCHGVAGVYQTAWRAARDARTPSINARLPFLAGLLNQHAVTTKNDGSLLNGAAGLALALHTSAHQTPPHSGWDSCLLLT